MALRHDSLVSHGVSLRQCNMTLTTPKGEGCWCLDGIEERLCHNPSPIQYNFAREQHMRDHFCWPWCKWGPLSCSKTTAHVKQLIYIFLPCIIRCSWIKFHRIYGKWLCYGCKGTTHFSAHPTPVVAVQFQLQLQLWLSNSNSINATLIMFTDPSHHK